MKFIRLANGDSIRADVITAVRVGDANEGDKLCKAMAPRVIVDFGYKAGKYDSHHNSTIVNFPDNESRDAYAAWILSQIETKRAPRRRRAKS